jgi:hypothetical protein
MQYQRLNKFWIGLVTGLIFPLLVFVLYWLFFHHQIQFPQRFIRFLKVGHMLSNVVKICGLGNLLIFYFGLSKKIDRFSKGVIVSVLFYVLLVAYVTYYHEPTLV